MKGKQKSKHRGLKVLRTALCDSVCVPGNNEIKCQERGWVGNVTEINTQKRIVESITASSTKDFNQCWKRNLKSRHCCLFIVDSCENNKHTGKRRQSSPSERSRFPTWYQVTKQYRLIIIYSLAYELKRFCYEKKPVSCFSCCCQVLM